MKLTQVVIVLTCLAKVAHGNRIATITAFTSDCEGCGMLGALGQLTVKVCGNSAQKCCVALNINNLFGDDFKPGKESVFNGPTLGECNSFDMGDVSDWAEFLTIYHSGFDNGKFDWVSVTLDSGIEAKCDFTKFLGAGDYETGSNCQLEQAQISL